MNVYSKSIVISNIISNTSQQMRYEIIIDDYNNYYQSSIYTRLARIGETSIHSFIFIIILVIDLDWTYWNGLPNNE